MFFKIIHKLKQHKWYHTPNKHTFLTKIVIVCNFDIPKIKSLLFLQVYTAVRLVVVYDLLCASLLHRFTDWELHFWKRLRPGADQISRNSLLCPCNDIVCFHPNACHALFSCTYSLQYLPISAQSGKYNSTKTNLFRDYSSETNAFRLLSRFSNMFSTLLSGVTCRSIQHRAYTIRNLALLHIHYVYS